MSSTHYKWLTRVFLLGCAAVAHGQEEPGPNDWDTPAVFARNREAPRADSFPYGKEDSALTGNRDNSPWVLGLDGPWQFHLAASPDAAPWDFADPAYQRDDWDQIDVPGCWQFQGYGTPALRGASDMPDEVGSYYRTVTIPDTWDDRRIFLRFEGVASAFYVWVNGQQAGYSEDGALPAEFDITPFTTPGENAIGVQVLRHCRSVPPRQDVAWDHSGIHRGVVLFALPPIHVRDIVIHTPMEAPYTRATLEAAVDFRSSLATPDTCTVRAMLYDTDGQPVFDAPFQESVVAAPNALTQVTFRAPVAQPALWTDETPTRYTLVVVLTDSAGRTDVRPIPFGFRQVSINNGRFRINGHPVPLRGVVFNPWDGEKGTAVDDASLRRDLTMIKQFNFNAIRTGTGPLTTAALSLCDELGIYIVEDVYEAKTESPPAGPAAIEWDALLNESARRAVQRDINHPSVIAWSIAASGDGDTGAATCASWVRAYDSGRPIAVIGAMALSDFLVLDYPAIDTVQQAVKRQGGKPVLFRRCAPAIGNGAGSVAEYADAIMGDNPVAGGFVAEWSDRTLLRRGYWTTRDSARPDRRVVVLGETGPGAAGEALIQGVGAVNPSSDLDVIGEQIEIQLAAKVDEPRGPLNLLSKGEQYGMACNDGGDIVFYAAGNAVTAPAVALGEWVSLVGRYDGKELAICVDGTCVARAPANGPIRHDAASVTIGDNAGIGAADPVAIDTVRIFDRVQTAIDSDEKPAPADPILALDFAQQTWVEDAWFDHGGVPDQRDELPWTWIQGLVDGNHRPRPTLFECAKAFEPVRVTVTNAEAGKVAIENRMAFTALSALTATWRLFANDQVEETGNLETLAANPGESQLVWVPYSTPRPKPAVDYWLDLSFAPATETPWGPPGYEVAWGQFRLAVDAPSRPQLPTGDTVTITESDYAIDISGDDFVLTFSKNQGILTAWEVDGHPLVAVGPEVNLWRAPTDADRLGGDTARWRNAGYDNVVWERQSIVASNESDGAVVQATFRATLTADRTIANTIRYRIEPSGEIRVDGAITPQPGMPDLPRLGLQWFLPAEQHRLQWYGLGPHETYADRKRSGRMGTFAEDILRNRPPYAEPQEFGNKCGVWRASVTDDDGWGIAVESLTPFQTSAYPFGMWQIEEARFPFALEPADVLTWNVDLFQAGVSAAAIGQSLPESSRVAASPVTYRFQFRAVRPENHR